MVVSNVVPRISISPDQLEAVRRVVGAESARDVPVHAAMSGGWEVSVERLVAQVLEAIALQGSVMIARIPDELTSTAAADLLSVSRPTLMKWVQEGKLPSFKVGSHTRFRRTDVEELKAKREQDRLAAFDALRAFDEAHPEFSGD